MENELGLLSVLSLLGAAQGAFLALALITRKAGDIRAHRLLAMLTLLFSVDLAGEFLYQTGFFSAAPYLLQVLAPLDLLYGPLIYLYVSQLTDPISVGNQRRILWHLLPALVGIFALLPFYVLDGADKLAVTEALRHGEPIGADLPQPALLRIGLNLFVLGTIVQIGLYLGLSVRKLAHHAKRIRDEFSDIEQISLFWLRNLLLGLGGIFVIYLGDQLFPNLMGMNILGDLITVLAVLLIYAMGYIGLRQPVIFTRVMGPPLVTAQVEAQETFAMAEPEQEEKYRRSGLDKDTGRAFLEELTQHMQGAKPYRDGNLSLPQLAQQLGISANYLSQVINEQLNVNFYDFVNGYRVEEAKRLIVANEPKALNVLDVAFESGFNSKSAFYTAFRKAMAMTPTEYRKRTKCPAV